MINILFALLNILWNNDNLIYWSETQKLQFEDFKKQAPNNPPYNGISTTSFQFLYDYDADSLYIKTFSFFVKNESWLFQKDSATLIHEQGHFDITEIYCRKFRQKLEILYQHGANELDVKSQIDSLYKLCYNDCLLQQDSYDDAVKESIYGEKQAYWNQQIKMHLTEISSFRRTNQVFYLNKN